MATTVLGDLTDAIPLLDDNGSGAYIKGRNNARDFRTQLLLGLVAKAGNSFASRPGMIAPGGYDTTLGTFTAFRATAAAVPDQTLTFAQGRLITERTGQGPYLVSQEGSVTYTMPAADASNPRIDVVYAIPYDKGVLALADTVHGPKLVCETGTPGSSPAVPSIPADAYKICEVFRRTIGATPSGNAIAQTDITDKRKGTAWHGTPRPLLPGDALADTGAHHGEVRMLTGANVAAALITAGTGVLFEYWDNLTGQWRRINGRALVTSAVAAGDFTLTGSEQIVDSASFSAIAGHTYKFEFSGSFDLASQGKLVCTPHVVAGGSVTTASPRPRSTNYHRIIDYVPTSVSFYNVFVTWVAPTTATYTMGWGCLATLGPTSGTLYGSTNGWGREFLITDLDA